MTIWLEFLYGMTTVGYGSLLLKAFGWYGSKGFFNIPACKLSLTLNWSWDSEVTSDDFLVLRSTGLGAPLLNAKQTAWPFFWRIWLQEVILVFLNMAEDLSILSQKAFFSFSCLTWSFCYFSSSNFDWWASYCLMVDILNFFLINFTYSVY